MADPVGADLRIWQDKNRDGVTQDGELKSLDQLGITELPLTRNPLSAQFSAGASLQAYGSVRGDDTITGTAGRDILIGNGGTDRIDAGAGNDVVIASGGQGAEVIGGRITDLSVAILPQGVNPASNDSWSSGAMGEAA